MNAIVEEPIVPSRGLWLITGAAGYIGSAVGIAMLRAGFDVVGVDNFSTGRREHAALLPHVEELSILDPSPMREFVASLGRVQGVVHTAGKKRPAESVQRPLEYFDVNAVGTLRVLELISEFDIPYLAFSSSCSVYGNRETPASEASQLNPSSPYALSKVMSENMIRSTVANTDLRAVSLRFFNVVGQARGGSIDWSLSNIVPAMSHAALNGNAFTVNGSDFPTHDGTCVRDYVHVDDIADAHVLVAERLIRGVDLPQAMNLATQSGRSVNELIQLFRATTGQTLRIAGGERRPGDPASSLASATLAADALGWTTRRSLESALLSSWEVYASGVPMWIGI